MAQVDTINFNSGGDAIVVGGLTDADWHDDQQFTIALFFKDASWDGGNRYVFALGDSDSGPNDQLAMRDKGTGEYRIMQDAFTELVASTAVISDATWYSVVITCDGSGGIRSRFYEENGDFTEAISATRTSADRTELQFTFGSWFNGNTAGYSQEVDYLALISVWKDTELSVANANLWAADPLNYATQPDYIRLYETDGSILHPSDVTNNGAGADGTVISTPVFGVGDGPDVPALSGGFTAERFNRLSLAGDGMQDLTGGLQ